MTFIIEQIPVERFSKIPFCELPKLLPHKNKLFSRVRILIHIKEPKLREFVIIASAHTAYKRMLSMNDFVMRKRKNKMLEKSVAHGKRKLVMMISPIYAVKAHI